MAYYQKITYFIVLCISLASLSQTSYSLPTKSLNTGTGNGSSILFEHGSVNLSSRINYFIDTENSYDLERVKNTQKKWKENFSNTFNLGYENDPVWIRIHLTFEEIASHNWYLHLASALQRDIEIYFFQKNNLIKEYQIKHIASSSEKSYPHPNFVFPFTAHSQDDLQIYIRVNNSRMIVMPIYLENSKNIAEKTQNMLFNFGIMFGLLSALILINLVLYFINKDIIYLYCTAFSFATAIYLASSTGIGFSIFWSDSPNLDSNIILFSISIIIVSSCLFTLEFFNINQESFALRMYLYAISLCAIVISLPYLNLDLSLTIRLYSSLVMIASLSYIAIGFYHYKKFHTFYSLYYIASWLVFFGLNLAHLVTGYILEIDNILVQYSTQMSFIFLTILFSFSLVAKHKHLKQRESQDVLDNITRNNFLTKIGHEIKTPMTGIIGMTELLASRLKDPTNQHYNKIVFQSSQNLLTIINDILDYSKIQTGKIKINKNQFNLENLVIDAIEIFKVRAMEKFLEIVADIDSDLPLQIIGDEQRIKQIIKNLLSNAVKFTPEGQIIVKVKLIEAHSGLIKISVIDSGKGIEEPYQQVLDNALTKGKIPKPSLSRENGGIGLGLTITKQLIEMMDGDIGFSSRKGLGSTFWVRLTMPACETNFSNQGKNQQQELEGLRILIVDDNFTFCELLKVQLEKWGAEAYVANNGEQALNLLLKNQRTRTHFDLVSIDLYMPLMDGLELGRQMNEHNALRMIPRVLLTSVSNPPSRTQLLDSGISLTTEKPVAANALYSSFVKALNNDIDLPIDTSEQSHEKRESLRILLVEDDEINQITLKSMLNELGHKVNVLFNGQEALELMQADDRNFDMMLIDCELPKMNGYEATRNIRKWERKQQRLPLVIVALTLGILDDEQESWLSAGMDTFIEKPINTQKLRELIDSYMF